MNSPAGHSPSLKIYLFLNAAASIVAGALMIAVAGVGSLSNIRLILIGGTFLLGACAAASAILFQIQPEKELALHQAIFGARLAGRLPLILGILFSIFWCLTWFPPQYTGDFYYHFVGFYPLILFGMFASGSALVFVLVERHASSWAFWRAYWLEHRATLNTALISLAGFALIVTLIHVLRLLESNEPYWRGASVPLLAWQVFAALILAILALKIEAKVTRKSVHLDLTLFLLIWAITAIFWARQPIGESYWVTGPQPPNREYYPFSDLETYDLGSQFALIGQGINNRVFFDRALYMSFLVYLHTVGGQNYQQLMSIQAAIFAVFPALMYLVGRKLHSRNAGIILAALNAMRGSNSLTAAPWIHSATFKHMLTDFPTAIGLSLFVLLMFRWLESPRNQWQAGFWAAGVLGLASLLRPHVVLLLPVVLLIAFLVQRPFPKRSLIMPSLTLIAFLAGIAPWTFFGSGARSVFALYGQRIHDVLVQRYPELMGTPPKPSRPTQVPRGQVPAGQVPSRQVPPNSAPTAPRMPPPPESGIPFQLMHYFHNLATSVLLFPNSPEFLKVLDTVNHGEDFWQLRWNGQMSLVAAGMLVLNLALIALGLGAAYQHLRWLGLLPLAVFLLYHLANSLARTSGGRYLVPIDWILVCYFGLGLAELLRLGQFLVQTRSVRADSLLSTPATSAELPKFRNITLILVGLVFIGALIPLAGILYPLRYRPASAPTLVNDSKPYLPSVGLTAMDVNTFLRQPGAVIVYGRALYPRYYKQGAGELYSYKPFYPAGYPRTVFDLIGPHGLNYVILPGPAPRVLRNVSDVIVLGCQSLEEGYHLVNAVAVILPQKHVSYARNPAAPLTCPLPVPACDNNGNCQ